MKFLFDFLPIALFFGVFKLGETYEQASFHIVSTFLGGFISGGAIKPDQAPIMLATVVAILATTLQLIYVKARGRKIDGMLWVSFLVITIFGGATIYFHNDDFIKWKPTIIYWVFGVGMLVAQFVFNKNLIRQTMQEQITLPEPVWNRLALAWMGFFFILGGLNLLAAFVVFAHNTPAWVNFKVFGMTGIMFVFIVAQTMYLSKYIEEEKA